MKTSSHMILAVDPRHLFRLLLKCIVVLTVLSLAVQIIGYSTGSKVPGLGRLLTMGAETNIPTWYCIVAQLLCAGMLWMIAAAKRQTGMPYAGHWRVLSMVLALASMDEIINIHSMMGDILARTFTTGILHTLNWIVPMSIAYLVLLTVYRRFLLDLPARTRKLFLLAAGLFIGGSIGMEIPAAVFRTYVDTHVLADLAITTVEEGAGEMLGVAVLAYALASYIELHMPDLQVSFARAESTAAASKSERAIDISSTARS